MTQIESLRDARQTGDTSAATRQRFQQQREQFRTRADYASAAERDPGDPDG